MLSKEEREAIRVECTEAKTQRWALKKNGPGFAFRALVIIPALLDALDAAEKRADNAERHVRYIGTMRDHWQSDAIAWNKRAEALERACREECVCSVCRYGENDPGDDPCRNCEGDTDSNWQFDETRFAASAAGGAEC